MEFKQGFSQFLMVIDHVLAGDPFAAQGKLAGAHAEIGDDAVGVFQIVSLAQAADAFLVVRFGFRAGELHWSILPGVKANLSPF
jgi:hypothetical protein